MIQIKDKVILLSTDNTSYVLSYKKDDYLCCEYYGVKLKNINEALNVENKIIVSQGSEISISDKDHNLSLNQMRNEFSLLGRGDFFAPSIILKNDKSLVFDFKVKNVKVSTDINYDLVLPLPKNIKEDLIITLVDELTFIELRLHYLLFDKSDVIGRYLEIVNHNDLKLHILKAMSMQLAITNKESTYITSYGSWANELNVEENKIVHGRYINESLTGSSSNRHNPFMIIKEKECNDLYGNCYGFNLIYSSNFEESIELDAFNHLRIQLGINSTLFDSVLNKDEVFVTPVVLLSFSSKGVNNLSHSFQSFINEHIIKKNDENKLRPVSYNSWEACYFKYNKRKIKSLIRKASKLGIELFVLDDGWFSTRNDDMHGLGDWYVNKRKLPGGLKSLAKFARKKKMEFGIWMEPEMVNDDTKLFKEHPDWIIHDTIHKPLKGRNQYVLDLSKKEVQDYVFKCVDDTLNSASISYVKWDYNRNISDIPNSTTFYYDYIYGLYSVLKRIINKHPGVLFENCASGGNRFDLGMLSFFSQSWLSDNTDTLKRKEIQQGARLMYPVSASANHVSGKTSHQLLRRTSLESKFNIACFGILGYELNLNDLYPREKKIIKKQISFYKENKELFQYGLTSNIQQSDNLYSYQIKHNNKCAVCMFYNHTIPNPTPSYLKTLDLNNEYMYQVDNRIQNRDLLSFGSLVNMISPIHIKEEGRLIHAISHHFDLKGESFSCQVSGNLLNNNGLILPMMWSGTGISDNLRVIHDFDSRIYLINKVE